MPLHQVEAILAASNHDDRTLLLTIDELHRQHGGMVYPAVFQILYNIDLKIDTAKRYWQEATLYRQQADSVHSLRAILFDYLYNRTNELEDPRVINAQQLVKLQRNSITDGLTNLYNQSHFKQELEKLTFSDADRPGAVFSLLLFDLDHFKQFNDRCGHLRGDLALAKVGQIISSLAPAGALAARYGGEEFAVILPETGLAQAIILADRIRKTIEQTRFDGEDRLDKSNLTISGGVASYPVAGKSTVALIAHADSKLYDAKISRNSISPRPSDSRCIIRHAFRSIVEVLDKNSGGYHSSLSADISYTGLLLKSPHPFEVGDKLELRFPFPFWPDNHATTGQVRHIRNNDVRGDFQIGIEFVQPQVDFIEKILPGELYTATNH